MACFLCPFLPLPFPLSDFFEKNMPFYFVLSPICTIFAVSINIRSFLRYQKYTQMRVLIVNTSEKTGGAAVAANRLMDALNNNGVKAKMLVRDKETEDITVVSLPRSLRLQWNFLWERWCVFWHLHFSHQRAGGTPLQMRRCAYLCQRRQRSEMPFFNISADFCY